MAEPQYQQRDHIYVLGPPLLPPLPTLGTPQLPNETPVLLTVTPFQQIIGLPVQLDKDAPFIMRRRAMRVAYNFFTGSPTETNINQIIVRFTGHDLRYKEQTFMPQNLDGAFFGQFGQWKPVYPGIPYPAGSSFLVDIINNGPNVIFNLTLYFRGVKLYPWGVRPDYRYPSTMSSLPYAYPIAPITPSNPFGVIQSVNITDYRINQVFQVKDDADFAIRAMQTGPVAGSQTYEIFMQLKDFDGKPYSTGWVHCDVYGGQSAVPTQILFPIGNGHTITAVGAGASTPNVFFPEIVVPRNQLLFYDILRADANSSFAAQQDYPVTFIGAKIFDRR